MIQCFMIYVELLLVVLFIQEYSIFYRTDNKILLSLFIYLKNHFHFRCNIFTLSNNPLMSVLPVYQYQNMKSNSAKTLSESKILHDEHLFVRFSMWCIIYVWRHFCSRLDLWTKVNTSRIAIYPVESER